MVERQAGERRRHVHFTIDHGHVILGEGLADQFLEQFAGARRGLAHLDHHPVAGGQRRQHRADGQIQRVVPGHDNAHHAQRLVFHPHLARPLGGADLALGGLHPFAQMLGVVLDAFHAGEHFRQLGLVGGAVAEVGVQRLHPGVHVVQQHRLELLNMLMALLGGGVGLAAVRRFLGGENALHALDLRMLGLEFFDLGDHNAPPWAFVY